MRLSFSVRSNAPEVSARLDKLPEDLVGAMREGTSRAAGEVEIHQKTAINRRTGGTASTIGSSSRPTPTGAEASVGTSDRVAGYLQHGTTPHKITATNGKALGPMASPGYGGPRFARSVMHPGTPAYDWLERAGTASLSPVQRIYEEEVERVLR